MTFNELQDIFRTTALLPWEHDYYMAYYVTPKDKQEFLDHAYTAIENLNGIWYEILSNMVYFVVKKGTVIPEDFADSIESVTDVPEQPIEEGTE